MKRFFLSFLLALLPLFFQLQTAEAQSTPTCTFQPDGSILCTAGGSNDGGGEDEGEGQGNGEGGACIPGEHMTYQVTSYDAATGMCRAFPALVDNCTGVIIEAGGNMVMFVDIPCAPARCNSPASVRYIQYQCGRHHLRKYGMECERARYLPGNIPGRTPLSCDSGPLADCDPQWRHV